MRCRVRRGQGYIEDANADLQTRDYTVNRHERSEEERERINVTKNKKEISAKNDASERAKIRAR